MFFCLAAVATSYLTISSSNGFVLIVLIADYYYSNFT